MNERKTRPDACARLTGQKSGDLWCHECWRAIPPDRKCDRRRTDPRWRVYKDKGSKGDVWKFIKDSD